MEGEIIVRMDWRHQHVENDIGIYGGPTGADATRMPFVRGPCEPPQDPPAGETSLHERRHAVIGETP